MSRALRLEDKVVLVTGGGRGIGKAVAIRCATEGAHVIVAGRSMDSLHETANEVRRKNRQAAVVALDLRDENSVRLGMAQARDEFGVIDVLVANSGIAGPTAPIWEINPSDWADTFAVNVTGTFLCCQEVLPDMVERRSGSIVVIGSMTGKRPLMNRTAYAASKMALVGMVRSAAADVGPHGIRINLISPGPVVGERLDEVVSDQAALRGISEEAAIHALTQDSPLGRSVMPDDVAGAVAFLASDDAASITGEDLNVSCGTVSY